MGGEKMQLLLPFHMSSPSCCCNAPPTPRLIFYLHNGHRCPGSYYLTRVRLSKAVNITSYYSFSCSFLIKPLPCTVSPEATEVESHHVLLWSTTFCFSRAFPLPRLEGLNQNQPPTISFKSQQNEAQLCTVVHNPVKRIILHKCFRSGSHSNSPYPSLPRFSHMC